MMSDIDWIGFIAVLSFMAAGSIWVLRKLVRRYQR